MHQDRQVDKEEVAIMLMPYRSGTKDLAQWRASSSYNYGAPSIEKIKEKGVAINGHRLVMWTSMHMVSMRFEFLFVGCVGKLFSVCDRN